MSCSSLNFGGGPDVISLRSQAHSDPGFGHPGDAPAQCHLAGFPVHYRLEDRWRRIEVEYTVR